ncbi:ANL family adenylate-forming protein [Acanthopleuribacter pedis]|uniref:Long-chain fatty acid--CoA ligase n=1 Tax=Acanthopleuribacter pedis TaxID=442870 RepID=A0A8J7QJH8_9BACT|nr:fatty acid--CoA ligase family protein [Acanthopleuribacter pedis]MBO1319358.1 long-chain fatty acid--CoA ligase [Acanthopleuribacter pedis]
MSAFFQRLFALERGDCLIEAARTTGYADLRARVDAMEALLLRCAVAPDAVVALVCEETTATLMLLLALLRRGNIAVPLPADGRETRAERLTEACADWLFTRADEAGLQRLTPRDKPSLIKDLQETGQAGLIVFSSGTGGKVKAALHRFDRLVDRYGDKPIGDKPIGDKPIGDKPIGDKPIGDKPIGDKLIGDRTNQRPGLRTPAFLKLDHIGGLDTLFRLLHGGGTLILGCPRTPEAVCRLIETHRVTLLPTTATFLNMILISRADRNHDLSSLRLIAYGSEPMPPALLEQARRRLPNVRFLQKYGLTELGVLETRPGDTDSTWFQITGRTQFKIVDGVLWLKRNDTMLGYLNAPNPFDADGWYNTGDLVERRDGLLRIKGRSNRIINVAGEKVNPFEVESVLREIPNVSDALVWGKKSAVTGWIVAATLELQQQEDRRELQQRVAEFCRHRLEPYKVPLLIHIAREGLMGDRLKKTGSVAR